MMSFRWSFDLFGWPGYNDASPTGFPRVVTCDFLASAFPCG
jgi:hypothetical protein